MTTNQTIDGVLRDDLRELHAVLCNMDVQDGSVYADIRDRLRALLDAPATVCEDLQVLRELKADADSLGEALDDESLAELASLEAAQPQGEPVAQGVGVLTFMRSTSEDASRCACCEGEHVFCRYFKGLPDFND